jgi:hypothetical protein
VVDASTKDRLGAGQALLAGAKEVHVFDHHAMKQPDIEATQLHLEDVGSVTTMVVEQLREKRVEVTDAEATLLAIGIHADTGSMTYDCTTVRDVEALAWVMQRGARQPVIAEFCHQRLTRDQQQFLSESFLRLNSTLHDGVNIGTGACDIAARARSFLRWWDGDGGWLHRSISLLFLPSHQLTNHTHTQSPTPQWWWTARSTWGAWPAWRSTCWNSPPATCSCGAACTSRATVRAPFLGVGGGEGGLYDLCMCISHSPRRPGLCYVHALVPADLVVLLPMPMPMPMLTPIPMRGHVCPGKKQTKRLVLIGRARSGVSWVDFDEIFKPLGGGGHMKAAAANIKFDDPEVREWSEEWERSRVCMHVHVLLVEYASRPPIVLTCVFETARQPPMPLTRRDSGRWGRRKG